MASYITLDDCLQPLPPTLTNDIDFLMRFENIDNDFKEVCKRLDIKPENLPIRNKSIRKHYSVYYDDELIQMVEKKFYLEISVGGYQFKKEH